MINYLDLFSGCGGFRLGLKQAGIDIRYEAHSDIDKYANQTYKRHFPESEVLNDIGSIQPIKGKLNGQKIDIISFGFPCQDISIAGKGAGLAGSRSGLFFKAIQLVQQLKPKIFIFENVKGLFSSNDGKDFTTVLRTIANLGLYDCQWQLVNTRWFLPQNRERIYFIGLLRGEPEQKIFPISKEIERAVKGAEQTAINCFTAGGNSGGLHSSMTILAGTLRDYKDDYQFREMKDNVSPALKSTKQSAVVAGTLRTHNDGKGFRVTSNGDCPTIPARAREDGSGQPCISNYDWFRRLTPIEGLRVQGFPDNWLDHLSDTQAYKQIGNAVSVPIPTEIFTRMKEYLNAI